MQNIEEFAFQIVFGDILYNIRQKKSPLSPSSRLYLQDAEEFLGHLLLTLDGMGTDSYQEEAVEAFQFIPNLRDVMQLQGGEWSTLDRKKLDSLRGYFLRLKQNIEKLKSDPESFYKDKAAKDLSGFLERISQVYSENYQVLAHNPSMLQYSKG
jgi:hypothetical protein